MRFPLASFTIGLPGAVLNTTVASLASHLIVMRNGRVVEEGPAAELFGQMFTSVISPWKLVFCTRWLYGIGWGTTTSDITGIRNWYSEVSAMPTPFQPNDGSSRSRSA